MVGCSQFCCGCGHIIKLLFLYVCIGDGLHSMRFVHLNFQKDNIVKSKKCPQGDGSPISLEVLGAEKELA